jgi:hypothetical protein
MSPVGSVDLDNGQPKKVSLEPIDDRQNYGFVATPEREF